MSNKLYPPRIEASLPAFIKYTDSCILVVPFQLNRAVGRNEFNQIRLRLKTVQTNAVLCDGIKTETINFDNATGHWKALFDLTAQPSLRVGQYYKVQIAFANNDAIGYYSDMALVKCTSNPNIYIKNLDAATATNTHIYEYTGVYATTEDITEKVYSYCFNLYDENHNLVETSGEQLHNSSLDTEKSESTDTWTVTKTLKPGYWYSLQYTVTTLNNLVVASPAYKIMQIETVDLNLHANLHAEMHMDDGYIDLWLKPKEDSNKRIRGSFILSRASSEDNFDNWQELYRFEMVGEKPNKQLWQDFTVQQGVQYKYALQAFNDNGLYSNRLENINGPITADFEDMFLFDGERQLSIKFNPQVSSFKTTILENKVDTIGGQYPFIFRSGYVNYKEFPISGLISMLTDTNELFEKGLFNNEIQISRDRTVSDGPAFDNLTNLSSENFSRERIFKLSVLDWLNNGKPKLFRSPSEGNYIVQLMNTSLSPNTTLGRMLHTFSSTAYEIADCNYMNLNKYGFIKSLHRNYREMQINQLSLSTLFDFSDPTKPYPEYRFTSGAYFISIANQYTSALILDFHFLDGSVINWNIQNPTGQFNIPINESPVVKIVYRSGVIEADAVITYGEYETNITNDFSLITKITIEDRIEQHVGQGLQVNLVKKFQDIRTKLGRCYYLKLSPRNVYKAYVSEGVYYWDYEYLNPITEWDSTALYEVKNSYYWLNGSPNSILTTNPIFKAQLNNQFYSNFERVDRGGDHETSARFEAIANIDDLQILCAGTGILIDIVYQLKTLEYAVETTDAMTIFTKQQWLNAKVAYDNAINDEASTDEQIAALKRAMDETYIAYVNALTEAINLLQEDMLYAI